MAPAAPLSDATDRLDVWRDVIRERFVALDIAADRHDGFTGRVRSADIGLLNVASVESCTQECVRTASLARADDEAYLQVGLIARGEAVVRQDGRETTLAAGDYTLYETDRPFTWRLRGDWRLLVLTWPRASVRLHDTATQALTARCLDGSSGAAAIVGRMLRDLVEEPPELSATGGMRLGGELADIVLTLAGEQTRPREPERSADALLRRIDDYVADHLGDPNLTPSEIAAAHFVSTRHLHRLFAGRDTTVAQYIQHLRLERARLELRREAYDAHPITDIALRWGFPDLATFSRAFRAAYGMTPTQCRTLR